MSGIDKETGIWSIIVAEKKHKFDSLLAGAIGILYRNPKRVADLGCGLGQYCRIFKAFGWETVHGYEGTPEIPLIATYKNITELDLSKPVNVLSPYDLVTCLEVGEHVPKDKEEVFLKNVNAFCSDNLVLSWAVPGQGGTGHCNEKTNDWVINRMMQFGFIFNKKHSNFLRLHSNLRWFKNTLMVFKREA